MIAVPAYAAAHAGSPLEPCWIYRREPGPHDVVIEILYCGICHTDIHQVHDHWGGAKFPMVPGHEIVGTVTRVGNQVGKWAIGDTVGVGCLVDSCRSCDACLDGEEQFCERGISATYNGFEQDGYTPTYGGYSTQITVDEAYVLRIPSSLPLFGAAPLLCAGISSYSPLRRLGAKAGESLAVVGLGGLGHLAVKIAKAMGLRVAILSHSPEKCTQALQLGADEFLLASEAQTFEKKVAHFHYVIDTASGRHEYGPYLNLLRRNGTMVLLGLPEPAPLAAGTLVTRGCSLAGSLIGGIGQTQEMLDFCANHGISAETEMISIQTINDAYDRLIHGKVRYRFVIDMATLKDPVFKRQEEPQAITHP